MNTYYISLVKDLLGCYLMVTADSELAVRYYLANTYRTKDGTWKLPWCSIYTDRPKDTNYERPQFIEADHAKNLFEENEKRAFDFRESHNTVDAD